MIRYPNPWHGAQTPQPYRRWDMCRRVGSRVMWLAVSGRENKRKKEKKNQRWEMENRKWKMDAANHSDCPFPFHPYLLYTCGSIPIPLSQKKVEGFEYSTPQRKKKFNCASSKGLHAKRFQMFWFRYGSIFELFLDLKSGRIDEFTSFLSLLVLLDFLSLAPASLNKEGRSSFCLS